MISLSSKQLAEATTCNVLVNDKLFKVSFINLQQSNSIVLLLTEYTWDAILKDVWIS